MFRQYAIYNDLTDLNLLEYLTNHLVDPLDRSPSFRDWQESGGKIRKEVNQADYSHKVHEVINNATVYVSLDKKVNVVNHYQVLTEITSYTIRLCVFAQYTIPDCATTGRHAGHAG